ncbi:MAG: hypothetical protein HY770_06520 [Chitinivibrionia bacterium]|nr:hypothetical protein [Chitinivibrionia bacterium]
MALFLVLSALYYANPWRLLPGPVEAWGIPFLLCYTILFPGVFIRQIVLKSHEDSLVNVTTGFLFGLFYLLLLFFIQALAGVSQAALQYALPAALAMPWALSWINEKRRGAAPHGRAGLRAGAILVLIACVPVFFFLWRSGASIALTRDTLDHAGYVNEIRDTGKPFPLTAIYADAGDDGKDTRNGLTHPRYALSCRYLNIDALPSIGAWNALCALALVLGVLGAAFMLFEDQWIAALAALLYLAGSINGIGEASLRESYYGSRFGFVFLLFLIVFAVRFLEKRDARLLVACACFAFAAAAVHIMFAVLAAFVFAIILAWKTCFPQNSLAEHARRVTAMFLASMAGAAPYAVYRYFTAYSASNDLHRELQGIAYLTPHWFIADPIKLFSWFGATGLLAFAACIPLWKERRARAGVGYLIAASLTIPIVLLNPILLPPLQRALTYLVLRLPQVVPHYMLAAFFIVHFVRTRGGPRPVFSAVVFAAMAVAVVMEFAPVARATIFSPSRLRAEREDSYLLWKDGLDFLRAGLPPGSVVASDPLTCYSVAALTPHRVTCTLDQHAPPGDHSLPKRIGATRDILSPFTSLSGTIGALSDMHAHYVVLNNRIPRTFRPHFWSMDESLYPRIRDKFLSHPECFEKLYDVGGFLVFRRTGGRPAGAAEPPDNPYCLAAIPDAFVRIGREAGAARLEAFKIGAAVLSQNDSLAVSFVWSKSRAYELRNYVVLVRFDHADPKLPLAGKPFPKLIRKATEAATGRRYRFRADHKILNGMFSPEVWPDGALVFDSAVALVPPAMAPGRYTVSVKLIDVPVIQNIRLRDLLYDDDMYQGVAVADIEIR